MRFFSFLVAGICILQGGFSAQAMILIGKGNTPVSDPGWPAGAAALANSTNRLGWSEGPPFGGGEWRFEYAGGTELFQKAVDDLALIQNAVAEIYVHDSETPAFLRGSAGADEPVAWTFTVWVIKNWNQLYGNTAAVVSTDDPRAGKGMPGPRLDLFLNPGSKVDFSKIKIPAKITIHDERAATAGVDTSKGSVIWATITDAHTGFPISSARLAAIAGNDRYEYTNSALEVSAADGVFKLPPLAKGVYQISARATGYVESAADYGDYTQPVFKKFEIKLARAGSVSGTIVDEDGRPVAGAHLVVANTLLSTNLPYRALHKPSTDSDASGNFILTNLPAGFAQIWTQSAAVFEEDIFHYHAVPSQGVRIAVRHAGSLSVRVVNKKKEPVSMLNGGKLQVSVQASEGAVRGSWGGSADLDGEGKYFFAGVHPGSYRVSISSPGMEAQTAVVAREKATEVVFETP